MIIIIYFEKRVSTAVEQKRKENNIIIMKKEKKKNKVRNRKSAVTASDAIVAAHSTIVTVLWPFEVRHICANSGGALYECSVLTLFAFDGHRLEHSMSHSLCFSHIVKCIKCFCMLRIV